MTAAATFEELRWACATHNRAGRHEEALACAEEAWRRFLERRDFSWFLPAHANMALGQRSGAIAALEAAGAENRLWRAGLLRNPALEPLAEEPPLRGPADAAAGAHRGPRLPAAAAGRAAGAAHPGAPLLLGLHGAAGTAYGFHGHWLPAVALGCVVASVQSAQPTAEDAFCRDDRDQVRRDLDAVLPELPPHGDVVLTGFSQGAAVALRLALAGDLVPARAVIGVGPSFTPTTPLPEAERPLDVVLLHGAEDRWGIGVAPTVGALRAAGHRVHVEEVPGLGHDYPADFPERLPALLSAAGIRAS